MLLLLISIYTRFIRSLSLCVFALSLAGCEQLKGYVVDQPDLNQIALDYESSGSRSALNSFAAFVADTDYAGSWPPEKWGLEELMYAGLYFSPRLEVARQSRDLFGISAQLAALGSKRTVQVATEYHGREIDGEEPWGLGFTVGLPFFSKQKQAALVQKSLFYVDDASLDLSQQVWLLHASLRNNLFEWSSNKARRGLLRQQIALGRELVDLLEKRVEYGFSDREELSKRYLELGRLRQVEINLEVKRLEIISSMAKLIGKPLIELENIELQTFSFDQYFVIEDAGFYQKTALLNRIDLQKSLVNFGISDSELKIALINRYPELSISPGYFWDQGDKIWNFALGLVLPNHADTFVSKAEALRSLRHLQVKEQQLIIRSDVDRFHSVAVSTQKILNETRSNLNRAKRSFLDKEQAFGAGDISRIDLYDARMNYIEVADRFIASRLAFYVAVSKLEDSCQTPLIFEYNVPLKNNDRRPKIERSSL